MGDKIAIDLFGDTQRREQRRPPQQSSGSPRPAAILLLAVVVAVWLLMRAGALPIPDDGDEQKRNDYTGGTLIVTLDQQSISAQQEIVLRELQKSATEWGFAGVVALDTEDAEGQDVAGAAAAYQVTPPLIGVAKDKRLLAAWPFPKDVTIEQVKRHLQ